MKTTVFCSGLSWKRRAKFQDGGHAGGVVVGPVVDGGIGAAVEAAFAAPAPVVVVGADVNGALALARVGRRPRCGR